MNDRHDHSIYQHLKLRRVINAAGKMNTLGGGGLDPPMGETTGGGGLDAGERPVGGGEKGRGENFTERRARALGARGGGLRAAVLPKPRRRSAKQPGPGVRRLAAIYVTRGAAQAALAACARRHG